MDLIGKKGYGMTCTCRRDHIPKPIKDYVHHEKVTNYDLKAKVMRFQNPITAIKKVPATDSSKAYTKTFVSFQSPVDWSNKYCWCEQLAFLSALCQQEG